MHIGQNATDVYRGRRQRTKPKGGEWLRVIAQDPFVVVKVDDEICGLNRSGLEYRATAEMRGRSPWIHEPWCTVSRYLSSRACQRATYSLHRHYNTPRTALRYGFHPGCVAMAADRIEGQETVADVDRYMSWSARTAQILRDTRNEALVDLV